MSETGLHQLAPGRQNSAHSSLIQSLNTTMSKNPSAVRRYLAAVLGVSLSFSLRMLFFPLLDSGFPLLFSWPAVLFAAWYGGFGPGAVAVILAAAQGAFFLEPMYSFAISSPIDRNGTALFVLLGLCVSAMGEQLLRSGRQLVRYAAELSEQREWFKVTLTSVGDAVIATGEDGHVQFMNPVAERLTGWSATESAGRHLDEVFQIINEDTRQTVESPVTRVLREGVVIGLANHTLLISRDGTEYPIEDSGAPIFDERGRIRGVVLVFMDATAKLHEARKLRQSEERFRLMADAAPVMIWISGRDRLFTWFNKQWVDFVGRALEQEIGNGWTDNIHPDDLDHCVETYESAFAARSPFVMEYRLRRHDGEYRWMLDHGIPLYAGSGEFTGFIGSALDITDRRRMEEDLRAADRRKDEFLAMLGHELRNPLGIISNSVQVLQLLGPPDPEIKEWRDAIDRQVQVTVRMLDDLLDVSRISLGRIQLKAEPCDLRAIVHATVDDYRHSLDAAGLRLDVELPKGSVWVSGDFVRLGQALGNLLQNAAKFTESGGLVKIRLCIEDTAKTAMVSVQDTGIGIDPEMMKLIFQPFSQADKSLHRTQGGLGLGLSLVKGIVELHGGDVTASSDGWGRGAQFTIRLPLDQTHTTAATATSERTAGHSSRRILIVEDNRLAARSMRVLLEKIGHTVEVAFDGAEGIEAARRLRPEVVLCDIGLPEIDGYEVAEVLRKQFSPIETRLIALSGYAEDEQRAREAGFDAYLTKPLNLDEFKGLLARFGTGAESLH